MQNYNNVIQYILKYLHKFLLVNAQKSPKKLKTLSEKS